MFYLLIVYLLFVPTHSFIGNVHKLIVRRAMESLEPGERKLIYDLERLHKSRGNTFDYGMAAIPDEVKKGDYGLVNFNMFHYAYLFHLDKYGSNVFDTKRPGIIGRLHNKILTVQYMMHNSTLSNLYLVSSLPLVLHLLADFMAYYHLFDYKLGNEFLSDYENVNMHRFIDSLCFADKLFDLEFYDTYLSQFNLNEDWSDEIPEEYRLSDILRARLIESLPKLKQLPINLKEMLQHLQAFYNLHLNDPNQQTRRLSDYLHNAGNTGPTSRLKLEHCLYVNIHNIEAATRLTTIYLKFVCSRLQIKRE
eukprot:GAHX01002218.1.p1 GENE.GAHX01002218.1~~GAHX01002218.1.p1  ORF type:complete len:307 (+),score=27.90 GAHX01002218.1:52-972(+)